MAATLPTGTEKTINTAVQKGMGPFFWSTFWLPLPVPLILHASFIYTAIWLAQKVVKKAAGQEDSKINLFSKAEVIAMIVMDLFWMVVVSVFISVIAVYICHGGADAWLARQAIKIATAFSVSFAFCTAVPDPGISF